MQNLMKCIAVGMMLTGSCLTLEAASWYSDPIVKATVDLGQHAVNELTKSDPHYIGLSENGAKLMVVLDSCNNAFPAKLFHVSELRAASSDVSDVAFKSAMPPDVGAVDRRWKGGTVSEKWGVAIPGAANADLQYDVVSLTDESRGVITLAYNSDGLDFDKAGNLYGNVYAADDAGKRGRIVRYSFASLGVAGATGVTSKLFTSDESGLNRIRNVSVYTIGDRTLVFAGEGNAVNAATRGKVIAVDVTGDTWVKYDLVTTALASDITNVKVSGIASGAPVLYVLTQAGELAVYSLSANGLSLAADAPVKTLDSAAMKTLSGAAASADVSEAFRSFEVTDDGACAFLVLGQRYNGLDHTYLKVVSAPKDVIHLGASDAAGASSYNSAGSWKTAGGQTSTAPHAGADYLVASGCLLRSPNTSSSQTLKFVGDSLTLGDASTAGNFAVKSYGGTVLQMDDLRFVNGMIATSWDVANGSCTIKGRTVVLSTAAQPYQVYFTNGRTFDFQSSLVGTTSSVLEMTREKGNTGTFKMAGDNTEWRGQVKADTAVTVQVSSAASFGGYDSTPMPTAFLLGNSATLTLADGFGSVKGTQRGITVSSAATLSIPGAVLYDGSLTGPGVLTRTGAGTLTLDGAWTNARLVLSSGTTKLGANLSSDAASILTVNAGAVLTLVSDTASVGFGGTLAFASGAALTVPVSPVRSGRAGRLTAGAVTVTDTVTVNFSTVPAESDELALLSFPATSSLAADKFALGANKGSFGTLEIRTDGDVKTLYACTAMRDKYHLGQNDAGGESSITSKKNWLDAEGKAAAADPYPTADYIVTDGRLVRTPQNNTQAYVFGGNSLTLGNSTSSGLLVLKHDQGASLSVNKLVLVDGVIYAGGNTPNYTQTLRGNLIVKSTDPTKGQLTGSNNIEMKLECSLVGDESAAVSLLRQSGAVGNRIRYNFCGDNANWFGSAVMTDPIVDVTLASAAAFGGQGEVPVEKAWHFTNTGTLTGTPKLILGPAFTESVAETGRGVWFDVDGELSIPSGEVLYDGPLRATGTLTKGGSGSVRLGNSVNVQNFVVREGSLALSAGATTVGSMNVAAGASLVAGESGKETSLSGALTLAEGAKIVLATDASGKIAKLTVGGAITAASKVHVAFENAAHCANVDPCALVSFAAASGLTADSFVFEGADGSRLPVVKSCEVVTDGGVSTLRATFNSYVRALEATSYITTPAHWSNNAAALDAACDYLIEDKTFRDQGAGATYAYSGRSYAMLVSGQAYDPTSSQRRFFMPKYTIGNVGKMSFYGTCGIIPGTSNADTGLGYVYSHQMLKPLADDSEIHIENAGDAAFFIDSNCTRLDIEVPITGRGRMVFEHVSTPNRDPNPTNVVQLSADNSGWTGTLSVLGHTTANLPLSLFVGDETNLGGNPDAFGAAALSIGRKAVLRPTASFVIDDANRGVTVADGGAICVDADKTLTLKVPLAVSGDAVKTGDGALELAGVMTGVNTPRLMVNAGSVRAAHGSALAGAQVVFAAGASLVVPLTGADESSLVQNGVVNLRENGIVVSGETLQIVLDDSTLERRTAKIVPLLTVRADVANAIEGKLVFSNRTRRILATLKRRTVNVGNVEYAQFYAECKNNSGLVLVVR